jgi:hypothetical protein
MCMAQPAGGCPLMRPLAKQSNMPPLLPSETVIPGDLPKSLTDQPTIYTSRDNQLTKGHWRNFKSSAYSTLPTGTRTYESLHKRGTSGTPKHRAGTRSWMKVATTSFSLLKIIPGPSSRLLYAGLPCKLQDKLVSVSPKAATHGSHRKGWTRQRYSMSTRHHNNYRDTMLVADTCPSWRWHGPKECTNHLVQSNPKLSKSVHLYRYCSFPNP